MITKSRAFSKAWSAYDKVCEPEQAPFYHFEVGFRAAWIARTALKSKERRKTVRAKRPVQLRKAEIELLLKGAVGRLNEGNPLAARSCINDAIARLSAIA